MNTELHILRNISFELQKLGTMHEHGQCMQVKLMDSVTLSEGYIHIIMIHMKLTPLKVTGSS